MSKTLNLLIQILIILLCAGVAVTTIAMHPPPDAMPWEGR